MVTKAKKIKNSPQTRRASRRTRLNTKFLVGKTKEASSKKSVKKQPVEKEPVKKEVVVKKETDKTVFIRATGKRKRAIAQIKYFPHDKGRILINDKDLAVYSPYFEYQKIVQAPIELTKAKGSVVVKVAGGGIRAQAEAIRLGIARALIKFNKDFRPVLKRAGYLKRDPRKKERKKPGLKRARRAPQWQKR